MNLDVNTVGAIYLEVSDSANIRLSVGNALPGIPPGGSSGYVLAKASATDYDVTWSSASGGSGTDSTKVAKAGDTMTGTLAQVTPSSSSYATTVYVTGDSGRRFWIKGDGQLGWDPTGSGSSPPVRMNQWRGWTVLVHDDPTDAADYSTFVVQGANGASAALGLQTSRGTIASPQSVGAGDCIGELAFRGYGSGVPVQDSPTTYVGWTGVALDSFAVETWSYSSSAGALITIETIPRASGWDRIDSLVVWDNGRIELDPTGTSVAAGNYGATPPDGRIRVVAQSTTETTAVLRGIASQTAKVLEIQNGSGTATATITSGGVAAFAAGTTVNSQTVLTSGTSAGGDLTGTYPNPTIGTGKVTSTHILDGTILDADINASAAIATTKLAQPANAEITVGAWRMFR